MYMVDLFLLLHLFKLIYVTRDTNYGHTEADGLSANRCSQLHDPEKLIKVEIQSMPPSQHKCRATIGLLDNLHCNGISPVGR